MGPRPKSTLIFAQGQGRGIPPESLQRIVGTGLFEEDVDHELAVVEEDPPTLRLPFPAEAGEPSPLPPPPRRPRHEPGPGRGRRPQPAPAPPRSPRQRSGSGRSSGRSRSGSSRSRWRALGGSRSPPLRPSSRRPPGPLAGPFRGQGDRSYRRRLLAIE